MTKTEYAHELPSQVMIDGQALSSAQVLAVARHYAPVALGKESILRIQAARAGKRTGSEDGVAREDSGLVKRWNTPRRETIFPKRRVPDEYILFGN